MDTTVTLYSSYAIIQIDELLDLQRRVSRDGWALLDPGLVPQVELQQVYMNCWNAVSLLVGTPSDFTWMSRTYIALLQKCGSRFKSEQMSLDTSQVGFPYMGAPM
jgi:hypothetical protein